ncbi:MAG: DNA gyrase inhibitor YacG [Phycisphaerae bacterium]
MKSYVCCTCQKLCPLEGCLPALYPFCSDRCKMADLGRWFRGDYVLSRELTPEEIGEHIGDGGDEITPRR